MIYPISSTEKDTVSSGVTEDDKGYQFRRDMTVRDVESCLESVQKLEDYTPHRRHRLAMTHIILAKRILAGEKVEPVIENVMNE